jgi:ubiquinone/menaquinone biosynthesis C-methylase UbiE
MTSQHQAEHLFYGAFAEEYHFLQRICPPAADMSRRVGEFVGNWNAAESQRPLTILELGCGTGITTNALLHHRPDAQLLSVDNAPAMLSQARERLTEAITEGRLALREIDALGALQSLPSASFDIVASAYTLHNFLFGYRHQVLAEIFRVLKSGGVFVNGDRYALDDPAAHLAATQDELRGYFRVFLGEMNRPDLLEQWVIHLFSDESEEHIMRLMPALAEMAALEFTTVTSHYREGVNTLVSGVKPWQ